MKKVYRKPQANAVELFAEMPILSASVEVESGTASGSDSFSKKRKGIWQSELWSGNEEE